MKNQPVIVTNDQLPDGLHVEIAELPKIIADKVELLEELERKVENANRAAVLAEQKSKEQKGFKEKKFLWMKWKSGDTKGNIEGTQTAVSALAAAQKASADAQDLSFKFQTELANISDFLFYLGCYNIAANEAMIANLNEQLVGKTANNVKLSSKVKEQFRNVVKRLKDQQDVLYRQQMMEEKSKRQDGELKKLNEDLQRKEEEAKVRDIKINEQSAQISGLEKTLIEKAKLDEEQTRKIEELIRLLQEKDRLDAEQSDKIRDIEEKIQTVNDKYDRLSKKLHDRTVAFCIVCFIGLILAAVRVFCF